MAWLEPVILAIVASYVILQSRREEHPGRFLVQLALTALVGGLAEESCIRAYGFYAYAPVWRLMVGHVPLLVVLVWPVVIHSASQLAGALFPPSRRAPHAVHGLLTGLLVLSDAALIEPVAVQAGLWSWSEPGLFRVPLIGVLGWAFFGGLCAATFAAARRRGPSLVAASRVLATALPLVLVGTHVALLAIWWGLLRWIHGPLPDAASVVSAWVVAVTLALVLWRSRAGTRVSAPTLLLRVPAAAFFFALLGCTWPGSSGLPLYVAAFVPPYLLLTAQSLLRRPVLDVRVAP